MTRWAWLLVLLVTLAVWGPTLTYQWAATWDDAVFILANPHVSQWSWVWMATTQWYGHWMPLTWLSFCLNYALFGFQAWSWHAVNVGLHAISAVLVYVIAQRLIGSTLGAVFAALLFSVHPLRMESVAWITERKDVLMGVFFLGAVLLWLQGRRRWSFAAFVCAVASKSPAVLLPLILLALDWYRTEPIQPMLTPWRYWRAIVRPLLPLFAVSLLGTIMAFWSLHTILIAVPWSTVGLGPRLLHMAYSEMFYAQQTLWPARLSGLIEYTWVPSLGQIQYPIAVLLVMASAAVALLVRHRWPAVTAGLAAYTVFVLPQSGIFQNGPQLVANRYSYLASLPLSLLAGGLLTMAWRRFPRMSLSTSTAAVLALIAVTSVSLPMWRDGDQMWWYAAAHEPTCTQCQDMASAADLRHGDLARALAHQDQAMRVSETTMNPRWERHWNRAEILLLMGRQEEAIQELYVYLDAAPAHGLEPRDVDHMQRARWTLATLAEERR